MGEAKRTAVRCIGEFGGHAGNPDLLAATTRCVERLMAVVEECAAEDQNWAPVLNAINTIATNLQLELVGEAETEQTLRDILRNLASVAAQKRFVAGGAPRGSA